MAATTKELILLELVFLRLGSAETDEQLQTSVCKFLPPVLLKLSSSQEGVRKRVMELLIHINRRVKSRPQVQLPVEALLLQYQDPAASSFVINFTIIYIKLGYPRMEMHEQVKLVPSVLNAIEGKPLSHQDSLMLMIMPVLGHFNVPMDPNKQASLLGLQDKPYVAKQLLKFMLDVLLLPYEYVGQMSNQQPGQPIDWSQFPVPPGLSEYAFKRVIGENPPTVEQLEQIKLGIVKFLAAGFFPDSDILIHVIVADADTRFRVAITGELTLKMIVNTLDWSSMQLAVPLYTLFLGTDALAAQKEVKPEIKRQPASTRIRLKLLHHLCHVTKAGFIIPPCIQVVFDSLYGKNTNTKLKSMALQFAANIVQQCSLTPLTRVGGVILDGMIKLISEGADFRHIIMACTVVKLLVQRIPSLINKASNLLRKSFDTLVSMEGDFQREMRDALISVTSAFVLNKDDEANIALVNDLLATYIESPEFNVRYVAMHYAANIFPSEDAPSRYLLLLACGDDKDEIRTEAMNALYSVMHTNESSKQDGNQILLPDFQKLVIYIYSKMQTRMPTSNSGKVNVESKVLPYSVPILTQMITYLRLCLAKSANVTVYNESLQHPDESTPLIARYLENLYKDQPETLNNYLDMILILNHASADQSSLQALLEVIGSVPQYVTKIYEKELSWLHTLLVSTKSNVRQLAAKIYGIITAQLPINDFETQISEIMNIMNKKNLEAQHGALLTLTYMMERRIISSKTDTNNAVFNLDIYVNVVKMIYTHLRDGTILLMDAAIQSIGILGKTYGLPLPDGGEDEPNKKAIVEILFSLSNNVKLNTKIKEKAILSLGYLCIGEDFPHTTEIINKIISMVKETKDIEMHLVMGEALVCCVQGQASPEHEVHYSNTSNELLIRTLDELLRIHKDPHPNLRQAVCVWLLALIKYNIRRECIKERFSLLHRAFMDFLSDDSEIVQDIAAKGLSLIHINSTKEEKEFLISSILEQFTKGHKAVKQVTPDTKLFEEGQLGKSPTNGNLSTYKEICSLATELQKPDLIYYFMHIANHNAVWTSKKGAAFGFAEIAKVANDELNKYLPSIIPCLYRYQFDPTPKIQQSMSSIWRSIVPSTSKAIEQYHKEILNDITGNLENHEWRVRISCCNALADLLRANVRFNLAECAPELWKKLFRVMDDIHEGTRLAAANTTEILSKVCVRYSDASYGKEGEELIQAILPVLLDIGIIHVVSTVRSVSLQTVSQLVSRAGSLLKRSLVILIPALLTTTGESENPNVSYLCNLYAAKSGTRETIDNIRAAAAKEHYAIDTITKCIQYIDTEVLKELMPKVIELIKTSVGFGTKIACSHFIICLSAHFKQELQPHTSKLLSALMNGLSDRNSIVTKNYATAIGHIVGSAKESSLNKLFKTLNTWYLERDDTSRLVIGQTLQTINNYNQEILQNYSDIVIPLTFFAMHMPKTQENENMVNLWIHLWNEITPGTESGVRRNIETITDLLRSSLESSSWNAKSQAANAVHTLAEKLGSDIDPSVRNTLLKVLTDGLRGRTWDGKDRLLDALATLTCNSKQALKEDPETSTVIVQVLLRESKKEALEYRRYALQVFGMVLHELDIDQFKEIYDMAEEIWTTLPKKDENESLISDEKVKRDDNIMKLNETVYGMLGKAWPASSKETQDKYCVKFITHYGTTFPVQSTHIQMSMLTSLNLFVDKLALLKVNSSELSIKEKEMLDFTCETLNKIIKHSIGISYTRIRKEALNIAVSLGKKLRDTENIKQFEQMTVIFQEIMPQLTKDNAEIQSRLMYIKEVFKL
ncbi:proteasome adapter and scaffold protein ECM29 [Colletes gigas]|uniref:proteasome adapter and scaffold protein ECM29 n=1 Tax=Colletes gigas TaxID=935657 RepID=UPI001C9B9988|nr:proteasome adapter and scaffold protein ECM29 [Colletes gigas]